jgi:hypothetical protein
MKKRLVPCPPLLWRKRMVTKQITIINVLLVKKKDQIFNEIRMGLEMNSI